MNTKKIILLGDSQTQSGFSENGCWAALLQDHLLNKLAKRNVDVINRGRWGYTTGQFKEELQTMLPEFEMYKTAGVPMMFTILLGTNDCFYEVPLSETEQNLVDIVQIVSKFVQNPNNVMLISPPAGSKDIWNSHEKKNGGSEFIDSDFLLHEVRDTCLRACEATKCSFLDFYGKTEGSNPEELFCDGLHFSSQLSQKLFSALAVRIEQDFLDS